MVVADVKTYKKNLLFAKYGHECEMENELDILPKFIPGNSVWARLQRWLTRTRMVSEISKTSNQFFRSQGAIAAEKERHLTNYKHIVHPFSDAQKLWKNIMSVVLLAQFILIPIDVAYFRISQFGLVKNPTFKWIRMILDCFCFTDVWFQFFTGYYSFSRKLSVLEPGKIVSHYLSTYFIPDFISAIPTHVDLFMDINVDSKSYLVLQITSLLKLTRFKSFLTICNNASEAHDMPYRVYKLISIFLISAMYFHWITCASIFSYAYNMGLLDMTDAPQPKIDSTSKDSLMKDGSYSGAMYTSMMLIANSGYGIVAPGSNEELWFTVIVWIISRLLRVLLIGRIMQVVKATTSASHKYIEMLRQLREYMRHKHLPDYMQRRLLTYYEFRFQKSYFRESEILSTISGQLRQEIVMHSCRKLVENVAFFKNLPLTLLVRIVSCLRSEVFLVNDVVVRSNTPGNSMFFIASGTVAVFTSSGREICHLEDGAHFGEIALVMRDELRVASVIAVEVCELYRLDRKEFVRAIHPYPDLLDNIQRIAADRMERTTMLDEHNRREMATRRLY